MELDLTEFTDTHPTESIGPRATIIVASAKIAEEIRTIGLKLTDKQTWLMR
jgi:hypothetical protein